MTLLLPPPPPQRPRLPVENSSDDEHKSSAVLLLPDEGEGAKENCRPAPLALLLDYIMSKFQVASRPLAWPSIRYQTIFRLIMAAIHPQVSCNWTNRRATRRILSLPPWRCCLTTLSASFQPPPSPWPGFPTSFLTEIRLIMATIRLQFPCNWTNRMATRRIISLPPWRYYLTTLRASF